jgi:hypothetical protein
MPTPPKDKNILYAGVVWIFSAIALIAYGILIIENTNLPGMEQLVTFLTTIDTKYIYIAAVISVFIEGLYFIGSFFPGATMVMILAILSQANGLGTLGITILLIFLGWCLAGIVNIYLAKIYRAKIIKLEHQEDYIVKDKVWATWFPSFRSSYEVAQIVEGGKPIKVFISSLRVRFWATLLVGILALILPLFINIKESTNKEGFVFISIVIVINLWIGIAKIRKYYSGQ